MGNASTFWQGAGVIGSGSIMGGISSSMAGGNFWDGFRNGAIGSSLNHFAHGLQKKITKDYETLLREKLKNVKIGESIKGKELKFIDKNAALAIDKITRETDIKFTVERTFLGMSKIDDGAYILIEDGVSISGEHVLKGTFRSFKGISIKTIGLPNVPMKSYSINSFIISGDYGIFRVNDTTISSFNLINK